MQWPTHFPENCPPPKAQSASGTVYYLTSRNNPKPYDFKSYYDRNKANDCKARGLSVYIKIEGIEELQRKIPAMKHKKIAQATLNPSHGKLLDTSTKTKYHHTWWVPLNIKPWALFSSINGA